MLFYIFNNNFTLKKNSNLSLELIENDRRRMAYLLIERNI